MMKKLLFALLIGNVGIVIAATPSASGVTAEKTQAQQPLNSPTAGSKQYGNGNFAPPKITGNKGQSYYTDKQINSSDSKADITGSDSYSSRSTAKTKLTGQKGSKYYSEQQLSDGPNRPTQGSRIGSNQIFNYPGEKQSNTANVGNNLNTNSTSSDPSKQ